MPNIAEYVDELPNISGSEEVVEQIIQENRGKPIFLPESRAEFDNIRSAFAIALHMHQPLIPAGGDELRMLSNSTRLSGRKIGFPRFSWIIRSTTSSEPEIFGSPSTYSAMSGISQAPFDWAVSRVSKMSHFQTRYYDNHPSDSHIQRRSTCTRTTGRTGTSGTGRTLGWLS